MASIHVGDVGTTFLVTVSEGGAAMDLSAASTKQLIFSPPGGGVVLTKTATFLTDGTDGVLRYVAVSGDLYVKGNWKVQAYLELPGWSGHSDVGAFEVKPNVS